MYLCNVSAIDLVIMGYIYAIFMKQLDMFYVKILDMFDGIKYGLSGK